MPQPGPTMQHYASLAPNPQSGMPIARQHSANAAVVNASAPALPYVRTVQQLPCDPILFNVNRELFELRQQKSRVERAHQNLGLNHSYLTNEIKRLKTQYGNKISQLETAGKTKDESSAHLRDKNSSLTKERDESCELIESVRKEKKQQTGQIDGLVKECENAAKEIQALTREKTALVEHSSTPATSKAVVEDQYENVSSENIASQERVTILVEYVAAKLTKAKAAQKANNELEARLTVMNGELEKANKDVAHHRQASSELEDSIAALRKEAADQDQRLIAVKTAADEASQEASLKLEDERAETGKRDEILKLRDKTIADLEAEVCSLKALGAEKRAETEDIHAREKDLRSQLDASIAELNQMRAWRQKLHSMTRDEDNSCSSGTVDVDRIHCPSRDLQAPDRRSPDIETDQSGRGPRSSEEARQSNLEAKATLAQSIDHHSPSTASTAAKSVLVPSRSFTQEASRHSVGLIQSSQRLEIVSNMLDLHQLVKIAVAR